MVGNPIRRKRVDFPTVTEFLAYLRTRGEPHSALVASDKRLMSAGAIADEAAKGALEKALKDAAHYGVLTLNFDGTTASSSASSSSSSSGSSSSSSIASGSSRSRGSPRSVGGGGGAGSPRSTWDSGPSRGSGFGSPRSNPLSPSSPRMMGKNKKKGNSSFGSNSSMASVSSVSSVASSRGARSAGGGEAADAYDPIKSDGRLRSLPPEVWAMHETLTKLTVTNHAVASLPPQGLSPFGKLLELDLSDSRIGGGGAATTAFLADAARLKTLAVLRLRGNKLTDDDLALPLRAVPIDLAFPALTELDVSKNRLMEAPVALLMRCWKLKTFSCAFNKIAGLSDKSPAVLQFNKALLSVNLSNNKLTSLGQFRFAASLVHLSFENCEVRNIPAELCMLPELKTLSCRGNPQRTVPFDALDGGITQLLPFLRKRLGDSYAPPQWVEKARERDEESDDDDNDDDEGGDGGGAGGSSSASKKAAAAADDDDDDDDDDGSKIFSTARKK